MRPDLSAVTSAELLERLAGVAVFDEQAAALIAQLFRDLRVVIGEEALADAPRTTNHGAPYSVNHALEYVVARSTNEQALAIYAAIHAVRQGILLRRQATTRIKIELHRRGVPTR